MESKPNYQGSPVTEPVLTVEHSALRKDLPRLIRNMKLSHTWAKGDLNAMVLVKDPERNVVLVALHEGTEIVPTSQMIPSLFRLLKERWNLILGKPLQQSA